MRNLRVGRNVAVVAAVALVAAACGSSESSSDDSASVESTATGTPIVIGNIGSYTGPQGATIGGGRKVIEAWAKQVNASGGLNGHPVKLVVKDDSQNPTKALSQVKELVTEDKVVAIVSDQSSQDAQWASYISGTGIPVVGGFSINLPFATNPNFFPAGANVVADSYGVVLNAKKFGSKYSILYCAEAPQCAVAVKLFSGLAKAIGVDLAYIAPVSASAPDYTALCQKVRSSGVQSYTIASSSDVTVRVAAACAQQGVKAKLVDGGSITNAWLKSPTLDGMVSVNPSFPWTDSSTPATKAYQDAIKKYAPGLGDSAGPNGTHAWTAGKLFEAAVKAIPKNTPVTSKSIKDGLYSLKNETLDGLTSPLTYTRGKPTAVNCWFTLGIDNSKVSLPEGLKTTCAPDAVIANILKSLAG